MRESEPEGRIQLGAFAWRQGSDDGEYAWLFEVEVRIDGTPIWFQGWGASDIDARDRVLIEVGKLIGARVIAWPSLPVV